MMNGLELYCGGSEYTEGAGSDSFTTMSWSAYAGELTNYDGSWDHGWMGSEAPDCLDSGHFYDLNECEITINDNDNPLLGQIDEDDVLIGSNSPGYLSESIDDENELLSPDAEDEEDEHGTIEPEQARNTENQAGNSEGSEGWSITPRDQLERILAKVESSTH